MELLTLVGSKQHCGELGGMSRDPQSWDPHFHDTDYDCGNMICPISDKLQSHPGTMPCWLEKPLNLYN
jgi:hypothetical protein